MKFGICTDPMNIDLLEKLGFDYLECALTPLADMPQDQFDALHAKVSAASIRCEAANLFLPGSFRLTGPAADFDAAAAHLNRSLPRFAALGGQVAVFGSGGARAVPEGWSHEQATEQLAAFCRLAGDLAAQHGLRIAIEPLNRNECNIINSVAEADALAKVVDHPNVGVLADWYHLSVDDEGTAGILAAEDRLWHCHIARPQGRAYPRPDDPQDAGYADFFGALRAIGYRGRVSVEGNGEILSDGPAALAALRQW